MISMFICIQDDLINKLLIRMDIEKKFTYCGSYKILKTLGSGYHAKVKQAEGANNQLVAIKVFKNNHALAANLKALSNEITIMKRLNHPNLVNLIEFNESMPYKKKNGQQENRVCIVIELAQGGELFEYVANTGRFSEETCRFYFRQLLEGLHYMHQNSTSHRDLKPENLLFDSNFNLKIADFGFSAFLNKYTDGKLRTTLGTEGYMAPEIHAKVPYDGKAVDLFASAIILFILYAGSPPFSKAHPNDAYYKLIASNKQETFWKFHAKHKGDANFFSPSFIDLMNGMFQQDPNKRFTIEQLIQHPWVNGPTRTHQEIVQEFLKRKAMVDAETEKERLKKQAEKQRIQQNQQQRQYHTGVGNFRSLSEIISDFQGVEKEYDLKTHQRVADRYEESSAKPHDFFTSLDEEFLIRFLLANKDKYCDKVTKLSQNSYKIGVRKVKHEQVIDFDIRFFKRDDDSLLNIAFLRKEGDQFDFLEQVAEVKKLIAEQQLEKSNNI